MFIDKKCEQNNWNWSKTLEKLGTSLWENMLVGKLN